MEEMTKLTAFKDEWEIIASKGSDADNEITDLPAMVDALSSSLEETDQRLQIAEAQVSVNMESQMVVEVAISG